MDENTRGIVNGLVVLAKELHAEAQRAYWTTGQDCGSDYHPDDCQPCHHVEQCKGQLYIGCVIGGLELLCGQED